MPPAFYLLGRRPITIMGGTTDIAITATTIGITKTTIIILTQHGFPYLVVQATTATMASECQPHRKRELLHHVSGGNAWHV